MKFITVAVLAGVIVLSARWEVMLHWPLPFGPPMTPTVEVPSGCGELTVVLGGSGNTPSLLVKPAGLICGIHQLPPHSTPTLLCMSRDCGISVGDVSIRSALPS